MDHTRIEAEDIPERYLLGRLSPAEEESFEEHLLECRECRERVQWQEDFRDSLKVVAAEEAVQTREAMQLGVFAWLAHRTRAQRWALLLAGLAVLALPYAWLFRRQEQLREQIARTPPPVEATPQAVPADPALEIAAAREQLARERRRLESELATEKTARESLARQLARLTRPQVNTALFSLGLVRSAEAAAANRVELGSDPEWIVLSLELPAVEHTTYRATLVDAGGATLWQGDGLEPTASDTLTISLYSTLLEPGDYTLRLEGVQGGRVAPAGAIPFRVERR